MYRRKDNSKEIDAILDLHEIWVASGFRAGKRADFTGADLSKVDLSNRNMSGARFKNTILKGATLIDTIFHGANLNGANLAGAKMFDTVFRRVNLSAVRGLDKVIHHGPSTVGVDTLLRSRGQISQQFMEEIGCPKESIVPLLEWARRYKSKRNFESVFISFGGPDQAFAKRLSVRLEREGVETFFFPGSANFGDKLHRVMRDGVNEYDKVILICSKESLNRPGVINEIEETLARESREGGAQILIPIRLDNYVFSDWAPAYPGLALAIRDRVIADFERTENDELKFEEQINRLIDVLDNGE